MSDQQNNPPTSSHGDLQNNPPPKKKRSGLGWWFGGIGLVLLLGVLLCCGGVIGTIAFIGYQGKAAVEFKAKLETPEPVKYHGVVMTKPEIDAAFNRCVDAMEEVRAGKTAQVTLTDVELNNLHAEKIANDPNSAEISGMDIVARTGGVKGRISVPDPEKPDTYLTMDVDLDLAISNSLLTFNIKSLKDSQGNDAPLLVRKLGEEALRTGILYGQGRNGPAQGAAANTIQPTSPLYGLRSLSFDDGKINIEVDPERVKTHNLAVGKPADAPLFEGD